MCTGEWLEGLGAVPCKELMVPHSSASCGACQFNVKINLLTSYAQRFFVEIFPNGKKPTKGELIPSFLLLQCVSNEGMEMLDKS